jgi:hypothetical protein
MCQAQVAGPSTVVTSPVSLTSAGPETLEYLDLIFVTFASADHMVKSFDHEMMAKGVLVQWQQISEEQPLGWLGGLGDSLCLLADHNGYDL